MRPWMLIFVFIVTAIIAAAQVGAAEDGLVAEWHFDEGSGSILKDSSGNGNNGTIYGATWTTDGKFGTALQFDRNDYIVIPDSPELSGGAGKNMTVEFWFNTNKQGGYIISKIRDVSYKDWSALIGGFGPGMNFWYENRGYDRRFYSGSIIEEGVWHHGAFTFQRYTYGNNAVLKMYLDGNELLLTPFYQDGVPSNQLYDMPDTSAPVNIGYAGTYYGGGYFNGKIDEIRVFDRVLTAEEIRAEYDNGVVAHVHNINKGKNYTTIQAAIDDANPGDVIHVDSGTYYENVVVNKQLTLRGIDTGAGMPVVDAGGSGSAITLSADGCLLDGFVATNSGILEEDAGIKVMSNNNVIKNNTVSNNKAGIDLASSDNNILSSNIVNSNSYPGIALTSSNNNTLFNNTANSNAYYGIELYLSGNNTLIDNIANSNTRYGIFVWNSNNNNSLISNIADNNDYAGIRFYSSSNNVVSGNSLNSNIKFGISMYGSSGNRISTNNVSFSENGIYLDSSSNNIVYHNNLIQNTKQAFDNLGPNSWDYDYPSGGNYWSDYAGDDIKSGSNQDQPGSDGIGDTQYPIPGGSSVDRYPLMTAYSPTPPNSITVTSPNGGENWQAGTTQIIRWDYKGDLGPEVAIELLRGGLVNLTINASIPIGSSGTGSYEWIIPFTLISDANYQVRITSINNNAYADASDDYFRVLGITPASVQITSPNNEDQIIEDEDATFSSQVTGGVPPYQYMWRDTFGNALSTSNTFSRNFFNYYGIEQLKYFQPARGNLIELTVTDAIGETFTDEIMIYLVPPVPVIPQPEVWQKSQKNNKHHASKRISI